MSRGADSWVRVKEVDSSARLVACVEGLKEGKPYLFRVSAENQHGPGAAVETTDAIVPRSQLGQFTRGTDTVVQLRLGFKMLLEFCREQTSATQKNEFC